MRVFGAATRGTTAPNRLRRVDNWITGVLAPGLPPDPLVVDLGYGAHPVTTVELLARLRAVRPGTRVVGLEIDPVRVAAAAPRADPPGLSFARGGFELAGLRPDLVRAMNVLRQYDEPAVAPAWAAMGTARWTVEGTCDELGRVACWVLLRHGRPVSLTLAADLTALDHPGTLAERLPKALIHHNVPGHWVHDLIGALSTGWRDAAGLAVFGPRSRWCRAVNAVRDAGWPVRYGRRRARLGELTVRWPAGTGPTG